MCYKRIVFVFSILTLLGFLFNVNIQNTKALTTAELQQQIAALQQQLVQLQQQLLQLQSTSTTTVAWCHTFNISLKIGDAGAEVTALKSALQKEGFSVGDANEFDETIASAVVAFQEKYASEILSPVKLTHGNGFVGKLTRTKLNRIYGCSACIQVITYAQNPADNQCKAFSTPCDVPTGWTTVSSCADSICTDTDNGKDYYTKGTVKLAGRTFTDSCNVFLPNRLTEYYCANTFKIVETESYTCPNGCENGVCKATSDCSSLYWYDNTNKTCGYKQFCGTYMYLGLHTFTTKAACEESLNPNCIQVITYAKNPLTQECKSYPTPCDVPTGWTVVNTCTTCTNDCTLGSKQCSGNGYQLCGSYDNDTCLEWGSLTNCPSGKTCSNGTCITESAGCEQKCKSLGYSLGTCKSFSVTPAGSVEEQAFLKYYDKIGETSDCSLPWGMVGSSYSCYCYPKSEVPVCTDSDGGKNYYLQGVVKDSENKTYVDTCSNEVIGFDASTQDKNNLIEHYCDNGIDKYVNYSCPNGCKNGACLPATSVTVLSPNGSSLTQGQQTTITWTTQNYSGPVGLDLHQNDNFIVNIVTSISNTGNYIWTVPKTLSGSGFKVRAVLLNTIAGSIADFNDIPFSIVGTTSSCTDSDGGKDYTKKGTVTAYTGKTYTDYCPNENTSSGDKKILIEYFCPTSSTNTSGVAVDSYICPNGCSNGACKPASECNYLYWYDNSNKFCGYKQFCGTYAYLGLQTFTAQADCQKQLDQICSLECQIKGYTLGGAYCVANSQGVLNTCCCTGENPIGIKVISPNGGNTFEQNTYLDFRVEIKNASKTGNTTLYLAQKNTSDWKTGRYYFIRSSQGWNPSVATPVEAGNVLIPTTWVPGSYYLRADWVNTDGTDYIVDFSDTPFNIVAQPVSPCTDSDGGKNYYVKGTVSTPSDSILEDNCKYNLKTLKYDGLEEFFCEASTGSWGHANVKCSGGCVNGACVGTVITPICIDTDGVDIYTSGSAGDEYGSAQEDCCVSSFAMGGNCVGSSNYLKEGICVSNPQVGNWISSEMVYYCPSGCQNGACKKSPISLNVSLDSTTPSVQTVNENQASNIVFAKIKLSATNGTASISQMTFETDSQIYQSLSNIRVYANSALIGSASSLSTTYVNFKRASINLSPFLDIADGKNVVVTVYGDLSSSSQGTIKLGLTGVAYNTLDPYNIVGTFPVYGNLVTKTVVPTNCIQVITYAKNPLTQECKSYPTPCDVPTGWTIVNTCTSCTDSDNGKNYFTKGSVTEINQYTNWAANTFSDTCVTNSFLGNLAEATCAQYSDGTNYGKQVYYNCPFGCSDGACLIEAPSTPIKVISPNGGETFTQGGNNIIKWTGGKEKVQVALVKSDFDYKDDIIVGWISLSALPDNQITWDGKTLINAIEAVTPGSYKILLVSKDSSNRYCMWATSGTCNTDISDTVFNIIAKPSNCTDTDGGKNYYERGTAKMYGNLYLDYCTNGTSKLLEYFCVDSSNAVSNEPYDCPNGCSNGACIQSTSTVETLSQNNRLSYLYAALAELIEQLRNIQE